MRPDWKEIFIESKKDNSLEKFDNYKENSNGYESKKNSLLEKSEIIRKTNSSKKVSPVETILPSSLSKTVEKPKSKKFLYFIFLFLFLYQITLAYIIKLVYITEDSDSHLKTAEKYLDILEDSISLDMSYILQDAKRYWTILKLLKIENSFKLEKIYFSQNESYLYFGVFQRLEKELFSKIEFFNYLLLGSSKVPFEEFSEKIEGIEISLFSPIRDGIPYLYNLTDKKDKNEICLAVIPGEREILVLGFQLKKWNELLAKREIGTYILLNHQGIVLAHSFPEIAKNVTDYSNLRYFDFIKKGGEFYKKKVFISNSGKKVDVLVRKLIPFEAYLVYLLESEKKEDHFWFVFSFFSLLGLGITLIVLKKFYKN